jgi:hypothetical protein
MSIVRTVLGRLTLAIALLAAPAAAVARQGAVQPPPGLREAFAADFLRRDVILFVQQLELADEQVPILEAFFQDYEDEFAAGSDRIRAAMQKLRPTPAAPDDEIAARRQAIHRQIDALRAELRRAAGEERDPDKIRALTKDYQARMEAFYEALRELSPNVISREEVDTMMREMGTVLAEWETERAAMKAALLANVQSILVDEQRERWPAFERFLRRQKTMVRGKLSGESLNIFALFREMDLRADATRELAETIESYDLALDQALRARNENDRRNGRRLAEAVRTRDGATAMPLLDAEIALRVAVRDVNLRSLSAVAAALPPEDATRLVDAANTRAFARVFRPTRTQRLFQAALRLDDLAEAVLTSVLELEAYYTGELGRRNAELRQTMIAHEPAALRFDYAAVLDPEGSRTAGDAIQSAFDDRARFEREVEVQLRELLTPEQLERLPSPRGGGRPVGADAVSIVTRFDVDGDGKLDAEEREAMRRYFRSEGGE